MAFTSQVVIIALIVLNVILIILYLRRGFRSSDEEAIDETLEVIRRRRNATEPLGSGNQERVLSDQEKEARREYVLMRVDVKVSQTSALSRSYKMSSCQLVSPIRFLILLSHLSFSTIFE